MTYKNMIGKPMKFLFLLSVVLSSMSLQAHEYYARIPVNGEADILEIFNMNIRFEDVRVNSRIDPSGEIRHRAIYNVENNFVTVRVSDPQLQLLQSRGISAVDILQAEEEPAVLPAVGEQILPYQLGWPRSTYNGTTLYQNSPTIADMNLDDKLDVSVTNAWGSFNPAVPPYVIVWQPNGTYLLGFPTPLEPGVLQSSADGGISGMGDIYGDSRLEIVCGDENGFLYAFDHQGLSLNGFPVTYGYFTGVFAPALQDLDNDGKAEIVVISHDWDSPYGNAFLHALKVTAAGPSELPGFPVSLEKGTRNSPAVGDLDGNGDYEIVVGTGGSSTPKIEAKIIAFSDSGQVLPGFPWIVGVNSVSNSPTLFDLDTDGTLEILIRVMPEYNNINGIYALDYQGNLVSGFPFPVESGNPDACVAVGDMTGDGIPELAYGSVRAVDSAKVFAFDLSGNVLSGYPAKVLRTWVDGSVAIADMDGDGLGEVVCGTNGTISKPGMMRAFNHLGEEINGFPLMPGSPILNSFNTHPTVADIDGDGDTELFAGRQDQNVYAWDTPGIYDSASTWHTFQGNAARTGGQTRSPVLVPIAAGGEKPVLPEKIELVNYPNPFNPVTVVSFSIPRNDRVTLLIYNIHGERVEVLLNNRLMNAGRHTVTFDGHHLANGLYFCRLQAGNVSVTSKMVLVK